MSKLTQPEGVSLEDVLAPVKRAGEEIGEWPAAAQLLTGLGAGGLVFMLSSQSTQRTWRFWSTMLPLLGAYKWNERRVAKGRVGNDSWTYLHEQYAPEVAEMAVDMQGLFVKYAQVYGARGNELPQEYAQALNDLLDDLPRLESEQVQSTIDAAVKEFDDDRVFEHIDMTPLASASVSQVHRAVLRDGSDVVLKLQLPDIQSAFQTDVENIRLFNHWASPSMDRMFLKYQHAIAREFDFELEARNQALIRHEVMQSSVQEAVLVPRVYEDLVTKFLFVMEFVDGLPLRQWAVGKSKEQIASKLRAVFGMYGHCIFLHGLFNTDPHMANFQVLEDGRVAALDFGQTCELSHNERLLLARLVLWTSKRNPTKVTELMETAGMKLKRRKAETDEQWRRRHVFALVKLFDTVPIDEEEWPELHSDPDPLDGTDVPEEWVMLTRVCVLLRGLVRWWHLTSAHNVSTLAVWEDYAAESIAREFSRHNDELKALHGTTSVHSGSNSTTGNSAAR